MLGVPTPNEADPTGDTYAFEKGAGKVEGGDGFADVWKRGHFAWEYKGKRKNLDAAYGQLLQYREALDNPPLLVVCDLDRFEVHTNFTNTPTVVHRFALADLLADPKEPLRILRALMEHPEELRPGKTRDDITAEAARQFASLGRAPAGARARAARGGPLPEQAPLLHVRRGRRPAAAGTAPPAGCRRPRPTRPSSPRAWPSSSPRCPTRVASSAPSASSGSTAVSSTAARCCRSPRRRSKLIDQVSRLDWSQVEPAIFGTLFERGLDPSKRSQLGAHYTDRGSIMRLIEPVLMTPLRRDFEKTKEQVEALLAQGKKVTARTPADQNPVAVFNAFLERLRAVRVLDPACGSGNFLYLALQALKDLEREAILWGSLTLNIPMPSAALKREAH